MMLVKSGAFLKEVNFSFPILLSQDVCTHSAYCYNWKVKHELIEMGRIKADHIQPQVMMMTDDNRFYQSSYSMKHFSVGVLEKAH